MPDEVIEGHAIEVREEDSAPAESSNLPAKVEPGPVTLFRTDDPAEVVRRATDVANVLADVLRQRQLTKKISNREHVLVEGWTLCGTMLGVFPVVAWSRPIENGWEARVEARTLAGAIVGAAEAECLRTESKWSSRDDYAIRSMAQTRAVSKALRGPLGFVVSLAGFDPTPEEEMPGSEGGTRATARATPTGPETLAPPGFPPGPDLGDRVGTALRHLDPEVEWREVWEEANRILYGRSRAALDQNQRAESLYRLAGVASILSKGGDFPPPTDEEIGAAFAASFEGAAVSVTRSEPADAPLGSGATPEVDESIDFGPPTDSAQGNPTQAQADAFLGDQDATHGS